MPPRPHRDRLSRARENPPSSRRCLRRPPFSAPQAQEQLSARRVWNPRKNLGKKSGCDNRLASIPDIVVARKNLAEEMRSMRLPCLATPPCRHPPSKLGSSLSARRASRSSPAVQDDVRAHALRHAAPRQRRTAAPRPLSADGRPGLGCSSETKAQAGSQLIDIPLIRAPWFDATRANPPPSTPTSWRAPIRHATSLEVARIRFAVTAREARARPYTYMRLLPESRRRPHALHRTRRHRHSPCGL